ncbi:hypothetical protein [Streptomyces geranii]|uniref:hypothetical protein n=1 Tax=Streptomyces geranii TaxID=2058923 RepID=UPI0013004346|nr:hypothetical protein [Streptomyces geranii]
MTSMDQGRAAIIAATAAGVFGITGAFAGLIVGRRQTIDHAAVEHGQWLRGQRQTACLEAIDAIDALLTETECLRTEWDERRSLVNGGVGSFVLYVGELLLDARKSASHPLERAVLLGPRSVDDALQRLETAYMEVNRYLLGQAEEPARDHDWADWEPVWMGVLEARESLFNTAQGVLWEPPGPTHGGFGAFRRQGRR